MNEEKIVSGNGYLIQVHVHLEPFQCFDDDFQLELVGPSWVPLLLDNVTVVRMSNDKEQALEDIFRSNYRIREV